MTEKLTLQEALERIEPADQSVYDTAIAKWDTIAKPLGSLGLLEEAVTRICAMRRTTAIALDDKRVIAFCGDNGVVAEGVTQTDSSVTAVVAENFCTGDTSVCKMAEVAGAVIVPVDMGMNTRIDHPRMLQVHLADGTANLLHGPAMSREQAIAGIEAGIRIALEAADEDCDLFATGEMGIGNTTTSSAVASVLMDEPVEKMTGPGAGLAREGVLHKIDVIQRSIALNQPDPADPIDVLAKEGGFDMCGMVGLYIGCAVAQRPCLIDGFISAVSALIAVRLCPTVRDYLIASHVSAEPAGSLVLDAIGLAPMITAGMRLGEGTGAVAAMPLIDMAFAVFDKMSTFDDIQIESYQHL